MKKITITKSIKRIILPVLVLFLLCGCDDKNVVLDEEYLTIRIDSENRVNVHVKCIFKNTAGYCSTLAFPVSDWIKMENFAVTWNGEKCHWDIVTAPGKSVFKIDGKAYKSVYRYDIPCSEKNISEHIITYSYKMPIVSFKKELNTEGLYLEYILHTGGLWHGNVSKLRAEIVSQNRLNPGRVIQLDGGYKGEFTADGRWIFNADDIELEKDIRLLMSEP